MKARDYSAGLWVELMNKYLKFWNSIRPNTLAITSKAKEIEENIKNWRSFILNTLVFSKPMGKGYSINYSGRGKAFSPITGIVGFSEDKKRFTVNIDLKPAHEYEFVVTDRSFKSSEENPF